MARTGTGTRRPRAKTTGPGAKDTPNDAKAPAEDTTAQDAKDQSPHGGPPESDTAESVASDSAASASATDTTAAATGEAAPEGDAPSAGEAPETAPEGTDIPAGPAASTHTETVAEPMTEPPIASMTEPAAPAHTDAPPPVPPARRGGVVPLVLGGVVAAVIGAGVALALFPQGWQPADTSALEARLAALETRDAPDAALDAALAPIEERITALEGASPDLQPVEERLSALEADETLAGLEQRIAELESDLTARIETGIETGIDQALAGARDRQAERAQAIELAEQDLAGARARLEAQTALAALAAAAETGEPAPEALPPLAAVTDLPAALNAFASGLPQLRALQASFSGAARDALAAAPLDAGGSTGDRVLNFLRSQTGARSLAPREGDDTDAILSRAEAHVRAGDLPAALTELDALPDGPATAMADWRAQAETRLDALAALAEVQSHLNNQ